MRYILLIIAALLASPGSAKTSAKQEIDSIVAKRAEQGEFSGAIVVKRGGNTLYRKAFGFADVSKKQPFRTTTTVDTGSLAKPVTATAILLLANEGKIDLDVPVAQYVAEFPHKRTTIRHLLSHSAGLIGYDDYVQTMLDAGNPVTNLDLIKELSRREAQPSSEPGSKFAYCNLCYDTLAVVIERITGGSYEDYVRRTILLPSGARSTFVRSARFADWRGLRTKGYRFTGGKWELNDAWDNEGFYGGSNLYFSTDDISAWLSVWADKSGMAGPLRQIATAPAHIDNRNSVISLGSWYCSGERDRCYYSGHHQGFHAFAYWDARDNITVAFTSNSTLPAALQAGLPRLLIAFAEGDRDVAFTDETVDRSVTESDLTGSYDFGGMGGASILTEADGTFITPKDGVRSKIYAIGDGWFYVPGLDAYLFRKQGPAGKESLEWRSVFSNGTGKQIF